MTNENLLNRPSMKAIIKDVKRNIEHRILDSFDVSIEPMRNEEQEKEDTREYLIDYYFNNKIFDLEIREKYPETLPLPFHVCSKIQVNAKDVDKWDELFEKYTLEDD